MLYTLNLHMLFINCISVKREREKKTLNVPKGELVNSFKYIRYIKIYTSFTVFLILG